MKKLFIGLLVIIAIVTMAFIGCKPAADTAADDTATADDTADDTAAPAETYTVGLSNLADSDVFCKIRVDAFKAVADEDASLDVTYMDANLDAAAQLDQVDTMIAQGADAIILVPVDSEAIVPGIEKANAEGIPVILLGIDATGGDFTFVGSDSLVAGSLQGEWLAEVAPENAQGLYLLGSAGLSHTTLRRQGFQEKFLDVRPDVTLLDEQNGEYTRDLGMSITEDWIQTFPEFDYICAANDQMILGALEALKGADRLEGVLLTGIDATDDAKAAVKAGEMGQTVLQNAPGQGEAAYDTLMSLLAGEDVPQYVDVPYESITIDNVDDYL